MTRKLALIAVLLVALAGLSAGLAIAASGGPDRGTGTTTRENESNESNESEDSDGSLQGQAAQRASDAALAAVGGGTVLEVESGDDSGSAYEVEVRKADGSVVEVRIDSGFRVVNIAGED